MTRVAVLINPISGSGHRVDVARARAEHAAALALRHRVEADVFLTERAGHGRELALAAQRQGVATVIAWGGDGTVNEVGSALAHTGTVVGIVPAGSGNGLARELGIPAEADRAFEVALGARDRVMDAGELDGHLFFNVAGIGLDARVAHRFAAGGLRRRGLSRYASLTLSELASGRADDYAIHSDGVTDRMRAMLVAIANTRQYGNGVLIAPGARIDDGRLEMVGVGERSMLNALWHVPRLFTGQVARVPGVVIRSAERIEVSADAPILYHVDGEPHQGSSSIAATVHRSALRVRVP